MNRAFIYGDLLFETIAIVNGEMRFGNLHYERLTQSANALNFSLPSNWNCEYLHQLVAAQSPGKNMRARLLIYRSGNGFYLPNSNEVSFKIEYWTLPHPKTFITHMGIYRDNQKSPGQLSNLKTGNALIYVLATQYADKMKWNDALILNTNHHIIEASSSNIFWMKNGQIFTPPLKDGPVGGVMRTALTQYLKETGMGITETSLTEDTLRDADEVFLTNAIHPIVSVKQFGNTLFSDEITQTIRKEFIVL